ncbi:MAG TPA: M20/M25/M40 family metallo-hydrolase [Candidatus Polarisedimenticolia bacterium]|nr:M20/M25/M40 family metallo-hydrolase [Candidatus Polarisedimenticolia bacterium]
MPSQRSALVRFILLVVVTVVPGPAPAAAAGQPAQPDFARAAAEGLENLKALLRLDTSNPPGNELRVTAYLEAQLRQAGLEPQVFESAPGRGSLMVRYRGGGTARPLLIMSHIDVVPVERALWSVPPFDAVEKEGFLWGRGTLDDKGMAAAELETMILLARNRVRLGRDVIFLAEADEEAGGEHGMEWLLGHHPDLFDVEMALNEGGGVIRSEGKLRYLAVQTTEKIYQDFGLIAHGTAGHSSIPAGDNPVDRLVRALGAVARLVFPVRLNPVTRAFFSGLDGILPGGAAGCGAKIDDPERGAGCVAALSANPNFNAMLRTTCTPTILQAGYKENVIPSEARANLNCRILPGTDLETFAAELRQAIGDPKVEVIFARPPRVAPVPSPTGTTLYDAIRAAARQMAPGIPVVPYMSPGGTDSQVLRQRGIAAYGLLPFPIREEDLRTMHANDEKIALDSFAWGTELLYRVVTEAARPAR